MLSQPDPGEDYEFAILGASHHNALSDLALRTHALGEIDDDGLLALFYSAIDVFVLPSTEDNLPNTIMEALACGTPSVAFSIGGIPDMIKHKINGYLCRPFSSQGLADGIRWVLDDELRWHHLSAAARDKVLTDYSPELIANRYLDLYQQLVE